MSTTTDPSLPRHPDTLPDLAPDCRRELRREYDRVTVAADRSRLTTDDERHGSPTRRIGGRDRRARTDDEVAGDLRAAVAEYRRVAGLWGVEV